MMQPITILIVDDHVLIRESWTYFLNQDPRFKVISGCGTGEEAVELSRRLQPRIVIMDINLPGINGMRATELIRESSPSTRILAVSMHTQPAYAKKIIQLGALGYVTKSSETKEMIAAILSVNEGNKYLCEEIKNNISMESVEHENGNSANTLTSREIEIIACIKKGDSSREIAKTLNISAKTVETHRYNILKKLKLKNSSALINYVKDQAID